MRPEELGALLSSHPYMAGVPPPPAIGRSGPGDPVGKVEDIVLAGCREWRSSSKRSFYTLFLNNARRSPVDNRSSRSPHPA